MDTAKTSDRQIPLILIADKDLTALRLHALILRSSGFSVITTLSSDRAFQLIEKERPDIILLALELQGSDAIQTCAHLKEQNLTTVPIIIISNSPKEDLVLAAYEAGARDYLVKPIPEGLLRAKIKIYLAGKEPASLKEDTAGFESIATETMLGNYRIMERLGGGSTSNVYKAINRNTSEIIAVKVLNQQAVGSVKDVQRFFRGSLIGLELPPHPNLVQIFEIKKTEQYIYQIMEFVTGRTLYSIIREHHQLTEKEAYKVLHDICLALDHLHKHQVLHRDVKPGNIFVTPEWNCKLGDMGISRRVIDRPATSTGHVVGTPGYLAPEQVLDLRPLDIRLDIYALGITLFHAVHGTNPFERETTYASILARVEGPELALDTTRAPQLSQELCMIISKMIRRLPLDRYESPASVLHALEIYREMSPESLV
jgi:CheY-like chemotaxis protein